MGEMGHQKTALVTHTQLVLLPVGEKLWRKIQVLINASVYSTWSISTLAVELHFRKYCLKQTANHLTRFVIITRHVTDLYIMNGWGLIWAWVIQSSGYLNKLTVLDGIFRRELNKEKSPCWLYVYMESLDGRYFILVSKCFSVVAYSDCIKVVLKLVLSCLM